MGIGTTRAKELLFDAKPLIITKETVNMHCVTILLRFTSAELYNATLNIKP